MRILFLDDNENRFTAFQNVIDSSKVTHMDWAETAEEAIQYLNKNAKYDLVCFDHDLHEDHYAACNSNKEDAEYGEVMTGYDVAVFVVTKLEEEKQPEYAIVHTFNPDGARRITAVLNEAGSQKYIYVFPFSSSSVERAFEHIISENGN